MTKPDDQNKHGFTNLIFSDDFNSVVLDEQKWNIRITGKRQNLEEQAYIDSDETVFILPKDEDSESEGSALVLQPHYRRGYQTPEGDQYDFVSGRVDTREKFDFTYGLVSARMKLPGGQGLWPAFWLLGSGQWPWCGEIDIMENVGEADWISAAVHGPGYSGDSGLVNSFYLSEGFEAADWHVFSAVWTSEEIEFYVDEILCYRITRPMVGYYGQWAFDNKKHIILNFAIGGTYPFKINGIKSPYYGLPQETVDAIQNNQVRMLVDWVRVYQ